MFIKSSVLNIEQVYGGRWRLELPWFQRAYAWAEQHVSGLVHDVVEAMKGPRKRYSFGHMSLACPAGSRVASLVDGHQRSISLTMLVALLRDLIGSGPLSDRLHRLIEGEEGGFRLVPQPAVAEFFATHVQLRGASLSSPTRDLGDLSPSERNMIHNRDHMRGMLQKMTGKPAQLAALAEFLIEKCLLVVDEVEDEEEARDLLTRVEERGLSPHSSELAKITLVSEMPPSEHEEGGRLLEQAQSLLSQDDFNDLLSHIRLIKLRRRSSKAVDGELKQIFKVNKTGLPFLSEEVLPRAQAMARILSCEVGVGEARKPIERAVTMLKWIDHRMWVPPALLWLAKRGENDGEIALFFQRLDRLTYMLRIGGVDPTEQEYRFLKVLEDIDSGSAVDSMPSLAIEPQLLSDVLATLRSRTFYYKRCAALVLRRISIAMDADRDPGPVDGKEVTIEHILPRKPEVGMQWLRDFESIEVVLDYCDRIGNLAFLSRPLNNKAANLDYVMKRLLLAQSSKFVLTAEAQKSEQWTRETIEARTEQLIAILLKPWQLSA